MPDEYLEAEYHFALAAIMDMVKKYGYCNVINDLDDMIADEINRKLVEAVE